MRGAGAGHVGYEGVGRSPDDTNDLDYIREQYTHLHQAIVGAGAASRVQSQGWDAVQYCLDTRLPAVITVLQHYTRGFPGKCRGVVDIAGGYICVRCGGKSTELGTAAVCTVVTALGRLCKHFYVADILFSY